GLVAGRRAEHARLLRPAQERAAVRRLHHGQRVITRLKDGIMGTTPVTHPARGESLLSVDPELLQQVDAGWRHRMSLYTGRALTDTALTAEQTYRSGRLALLSQLVSPGVASGLDASIDSSGNIHVQPGYGF